MTDDPLDFVAHALGSLPTDPAATSVEDLVTLAAAQEGFTRHTARLNEAMAALEEQTRGDLDDAELHAALRERGRLHWLEGRTRLAAQHLNTYTAAALEAHGINTAALGGD